MPTVKPSFTPEVALDERGRHAAISCAETGRRADAFKLKTEVFQEKTGSSCFKAAGRTGVFLRAGHSRCLHAHASAVETIAARGRAPGLFIVTSL